MAMRSASLSRPGVPAMASLAVNGVLIATLLTLGAGRQERWTQSPALSVLSLAALKGSEQGEEQAPTAAPAAHSEPEPRQQAAPPVSAAAPPPIPSPLALPADPSPPVAAATTPAAARNPAPLPLSSPVAAAQGSPHSTAAPSAAPQRRGIAEGLDADAPAGKSMAYAARVRSWLYAHKIYPRRARMHREEGIVRARFILDRTGALIDGMIVAGSGKPVLDEEAMAMMRRASPYPRAPETVAGDRLEFTAPIEFTLPIV